MPGRVSYRLFLRGVEASEPVEALTRDQRIYIMRHIMRILLTFFVRFLVVRTVISVSGAPLASCKRLSKQRFNARTQKPMRTLLMASAALPRETCCSSATYADVRPPTVTHLIVAD